MQDARELADAYEGKAARAERSVGLGVLAQLINEEVDEVVGPKGRDDPHRTAVRHGHEDGSVMLGGRAYRSNGRGHVERGRRQR